MKTQLTIHNNGSRTFVITEPVSRRNPVSALLLSLLWAAALALPVLGAQAAVVFTTLYSFTGTNDGAGPRAALVQGSDGSFYGTTSGGGAYTNQYGSGYGTVFKIGPTGALTTLYSFGSVQDTNGNPLDGDYSNGLVQSSDGSFYGTTVGGGTNGFGTVFKINTNGLLTTLHVFMGNDGAWPSGLVQGSDGNFYGMTTGGEPPSGSSGTIFQISTNGALTTLHSNYLTSFAAINLVQGSDGYFYGTTSGGIFAGSGYVFKFSLNGALTILYIFGGGNDGADPNGLVQGSDGYFYGTTTFGGTNSDGTVFKIGPTGALTSLYSFGSVQDTNGVPLDGANPFAAPIIGTFGCLVQGNDGYFYGTTGGGGTNGAGTVFRISTNGALTSLYSFKGTNDGAGPNGLVQGTDGSFYGTTEFGGATNYDAGWERYGYGTVFRLSIVPEPPQLTIVPSGLYVILTWPTNYAGFSYAGYVLQSTTNLGSSALWNPVSTSPVIIGGQKVVINPISGTQQFFRLSQ